MRYRTGAAADAAELRLTLLDALGQLSPRDRAIIVLRYWEDHSIPGRLRHGPAPEYGTAVVVLAAAALAGLVHRPPKPSTASARDASPPTCRGLSLGMAITHLVGDGLPDRASSANASATSEPGSSWTEPQRVAAAGASCGQPRSGCHKLVS